MSEAGAGRAIAAWPCQSICIWAATDEVYDDERHGELTVLRCAGCDSEWIRTEPWTPVDACGVVPDEVAAERARPRDLTSVPVVGAADNVGRCTPSDS